MTVHQIIYLCHTFIIQLHLSQIHPTKMKSKFENPHQTKQKLILQPPNSTPHKKQLHTPQKNKRFKAQNLNIFLSAPTKNNSKTQVLSNQAPPIRTFSGQFKIQNLKYFFSLPPQNNQTKNANFPYTLSKKQLLQKLKNHNDSPRPKISLILP